MGSQPAAELGEVTGSFSSVSFNPELEDCRARWMEQLQLEEKRWQPDPEVLPSRVTKRKKGRARLSDWKEEQEIRDKLQLDEALRLYREVKVRQAARQRYESPIWSSRGEGEEDEEITRGATGGVSQCVEILEQPEPEIPFPEADESDGGRTPPAGKVRLHRGRKKPKIPPMSGKFDGNAKELGLFLALVNNHMMDWGENYWSQAAQVRAVTQNLTGRAAAWFVSLYSGHSPSLQNYEHFMTALRRRFEDPLAEQKAKSRMKTIRQGRRPVADYSQEFSDLVPLMRGWSEVTLVDIYKDGLNGDLYELCRAQASPTTLYDWYTLAAEMEIELVKDRGRRERAGRSNPAHFHRGPPKDALMSESGRQRSTACYRCGKEGHRAADCQVKLVPKTTPSGGKELVKPTAKA
ncbi:receptor activity-modifying protein 1 isoform X1 [Ahaetulla prasina]|uniref:receptor activity-modifying protein 1 isoform X1 n=1 Tax=Ahaetulla prasina TaxID=499056 RepID=UPI00264875C2|nr:receptor activity-modifying protein 1 isoform X1 [Ahaetulla prasina]